MKIFSEEKILNQLKELSHKTGLTVNDLRVILALERAVARIEAEPNLAESLIFKGGFLLFKSIDTTRYTRDVDALAQGISPTNVAKFIKQALDKYLDDCLWFCEVRESPLPNQGPYGGLQFSVAFQISSKPPNARQIKRLSRIHIDVGFGDSIISPQKRVSMPLLLPDMESVSWLVYPLESILAEKLESLLRRGSSSSRAKDVYDLVLLFDKCHDAQKLKEAIALTFSNRRMPLPISFAARIKDIDIKILDKAWGSVFIVGQKKAFADMMSELIVCSTKLDQIFAI